MSIIPLDVSPLCIISHHASSHLKYWLSQIFNLVGALNNRPDLVLLWYSGFEVSLGQEDGGKGEGAVWLDCGCSPVTGPPTDTSLVSKTKTFCIGLVTVLPEAVFISIDLTSPSFPTCSFTTLPSFQFSLGTESSCIMTTESILRLPVAYVPEQGGRFLIYWLDQTDQNLSKVSSLICFLFNRSVEFVCVFSTLADRNGFLPMRKWAGVKGASSVIFSPTKVNGLEFTHAFTSWRQVSSSVRVQTLRPKVFFKAALIGLFNLSYHPPHKGALKAIFPIWEREGRWPIRISLLP